MEYEKKLGCFYPCTNVNFCILLAFLRCTIQTENFPKISFWVETSNVSDFELNVFQRVKFKNTISKIPRILDWVFYNVPDFESIFFWEGNKLRKNIGLKRFTFWYIFSEKKRQFCHFAWVFKKHDCDQNFQFSIRFWIKTCTACQILNYKFWTRQILHQWFWDVPHF